MSKKHSLLRAFKYLNLYINTSHKVKEILKSPPVNDYEHDSNLKKLIKKHGRVYLKLYQSIKSIVKKETMVNSLFEGKYEEIVPRLRIFLQNEFGKNQWSDVIDAAKNFAKKSQLE